MLTRTTIVLSVLLWIAVCARGEQPFDSARVRALGDARGGVPASVRLADGIALLREECAISRSPRWGAAGGPVDSGYIQGVIVGDLAFPAADAPDQLKDAIAHEKDAHVRDCLTVVLGEIGDQGVLPELVRIAAHDPQGALRQSAVMALGRLALPAQAASSGTWAARKPLSSDARATVAKALMAALADPFVRYHKGVRLHPSGYDPVTGETYVGTQEIGPDERSLYYPVQSQAAEGLGLLGYWVKQDRVGDVVGGWRVFDKAGKQVYAVSLRVPFVRNRLDPAFD